MVVIYLGYIYDACETRRKMAKLSPSAQRTVLVKIIHTTPCSRPISADFKRPMRPTLERRWRVPGKTRRCCFLSRDTDVGGLRRYRNRSSLGAATTGFTKKPMDFSLCLFDGLSRHILIRPRIPRREVHRKPWTLLKRLEMSSSYL